MHIHILGICGTFMGSLAILAKSLGYKVTGSDANVYPPMSTQLTDAGIALIEGFDESQLNPAPDLTIIGNAMSRGNPCVEAILNQGLPYISGPQWLAEHVLRNRWVLACSGTHGKTSTSSMLAWILEHAGMSPGFLIGGIPTNFGLSARIGGSDFFVIEADEYDSAFFDKRSKFIHYHPKTLVINNMEYDHADIFPDLKAIQQQFHHLIRIVPSIGQVIYPANNPSIETVIENGVWSNQAQMIISQESHPEIAWQACLDKADGSEFSVFNFGKPVATVKWNQLGLHNVHNGLMAIAAAKHVGVNVQHAANALHVFTGVKRRLEVLATINNITIYDDFAHHPTAIQTTLHGLRANLGDSKEIVAVIEPRSNTMKLGIHATELNASIAAANQSFWLQPEGMSWSLAEYLTADTAKVYHKVDELLVAITRNAKPGQHIVIMSNGGFAGLHQRLIKALTEKA